MRDYDLREHDEESCWQKRRRKIRRQDDRHARRNIIHSLIKLVRYRPTDNSSVTTNFMPGNQQPRVVSHRKAPPWEIRYPVPAQRQRGTEKKSL